MRLISNRVHAQGWGLTSGHQTAVFRSGETCPEAGSKRALPSNKPRALPPENGFPLNNVRVRGQADPYTKHTEREGAPLRNGPTVWPTGSLARPDHLEAGDQPGRKSRRTMGSEPRGGQPYQRALDDDQPGVPATDDFGGLGEGGALCQDRVKHGRSCRTFSTIQHHCSSDCDLAPVKPVPNCPSQAQRTLGWGNLAQAPQALRHDTTTTTTMPGSCCESVPPRWG